MSDQFAGLDATAQAELVRSGQTSPLELVDAAIARIEKLNPQLNAVITPLFEKARAQAVAADLPDGPFRGVPFLMKDLDAQSAGDPFHCGTKFLRDARYVAAGDSYLAAKFRQAGLVTLGKTNTPELGLAVTTEPEAYGATRNPWNTEHSTGGSSGGSAAAVASGMVPVAHASDGGGSIRIPASECGLVGLKPSRGRVSLGPDYGDYWQGLVISHVVSRSLRDCAALLDAIAAPMPGDPYFTAPPARSFASEVGADPGKLRIGIMASCPPGATEIDPECAAAVTEAGKLLESLGHKVELAHPSALDEFPEAARHFTVIVAAWVAAALEEWGGIVGAEVGAGGVEPATWALAELGRAVSATQYLDTVKWVHRYSRRMAGWFAGGFDVLVTPTLAMTPPKLGELVPPRDNPLAATAKVTGVIPFTPPFNFTGQPAVSLPLHLSASGLPVGVQFVAEHPRDDLLIRLASQIEQAQPWAERRPPLFA